MHITRMEDEHLEEMVEVDKIAFDRDQQRSIENFQALKLTDPEGCFVILDEGDVVGYSYSKTSGSEGYLGPVALLPEYQNRGYGKFLISKNLEYLRSSCRVIGLEVQPEYGENIGLYHKMGFVSGFPSLIFQFPDRMTTSGEGFEVRLLSGFMIEQAKIIDKIDGWTRACFDDVSYRKDIEATVDLKGTVMVSFDQGEPVGFLAYLKNLVPNLWGVVKVVDAQINIMREMLQVFNEFSGEERLKIEVNSRYSDLVDLLIQMNFKVHRSVNRMFLNGYEGNHFKRSKEMVMRAWRG